MRSGRFVVVLMVSLGMGLGCIGKPRLDARSPESVWPFHHGDRGSTSAKADGSFNGKFNLLWETKLGDKPAGPLTCYHNALIYPGTRKKIRFFDCRSGTDLARIRIRGIPQTGVVMADSNLYFALAPPRNSLVALDFYRSKQRWSKSIKDASAGSIIVDSSLIVSTAEGHVSCFALATGRQLWSVQLQGRAAAPPSVQKAVIIQPTDNGLVYGLDVSDGKQRFKFDLKGTFVSAVAAESLLYAGDIAGVLYALQPANGAVVWTVHLDGPIWSTPAVGTKFLYVGHSGGQIVAIDKMTGKTAWQFTTMDVVRCSPLVVGDVVIAGTLSGKLYALDAASGAEISRTDVGGSLQFSAVTDGKRVMVATQSGKILCFGERDERH